ncbi:MAG TPA: (d)CMP kinase [Thermoanaerobaculia bacterium]
MKALVVAIDGPSGVGKSTVGKALAARLGVPYLDTGAMYRAVGLAVKRKGIALPLEDPAAVVAIASGLNVRVTGSAEDARTWLNGEDVSNEIRTPEISNYASAVSAVPGVRRRLAGMQRGLALEGGGVLEGRDIGTKVVPETPHKFFLTASPAVRARRRFVELSAKDSRQTYDQVLADMEARDHADATRTDSPLTDDGTYARLDTSTLSVEQVVDSLLSAVGRPVPPAG